jgi:hypothetical protein
MGAFTVSLAKLAHFLMLPGIKFVSEDSRAVIRILGAQKYG